MATSSHTTSVPSFINTLQTTALKELPKFTGDSSQKLLNLSIQSNNLVDLPN